MKTKKIVLCVLTAYIVSPTIDKSSVSCYQQTIVKVTGIQVKKKVQLITKTNLQCMYLFYFIYSIKKLIYFHQNIFVLVTNIYISHP